MNKLLENPMLAKFRERHEHFTIKVDEDVEKLARIAERYPKKVTNKEAMQKSELSQLLHEEETGYAHEKNISQEEKEFRHKYLKSQMSL